MPTPLPRLGLARTADEEASLSSRAELSALEHALLAQITPGISGLRADLQEIRGEIARSTRLHIGAFVLLWLLTVFTLAVVALKDGVDPRAAAEAVQIVSPAVPR